MAGKGDGRRPSAVSAKEFEANWRRIFATSEDTVLAEIEQKLATMVAKSQRDPAARHAR